jgi:hypothetical protein
MAWKSVTWAERKFREGGKYLDRSEVRKDWVDRSNVRVRMIGLAEGAGGMARPRYV